MQILDHTHDKIRRKSRKLMILNYGKYYIDALEEQPRILEQFSLINSDFFTNSILENATYDF